MAYNEEANIGHLLAGVQAQVLSGARLVEIVVVVSGCTDRTEEIVRTVARSDSRVKVIVQSSREGKASAINLFLSQAVGDIFMLESADTIPQPGAFESLLAPFTDKNVGMVGAHPVPVNSLNTFTGYAVNLLWSLHHEIAMISPKLGELVAFRNFVREIPVDTAVDEASIEAIVCVAGYKLAYAPEAIVHNKGPETVGEFIKQRRRIAAGHRYLRATNSYKVSTHNGFMIARILLTTLGSRFRRPAWTAGVVILELVSRIWGTVDYYIAPRKHVVWDVSGSTKSGVGRA
jgi:cellulose synthase/poly-beta-1,6-N-acetylglucosamine synthase-like glycosyltransferase